MNKGLEAHKYNNPWSGDSQPGYWFLTLDQPDGLNLFTVVSIKQKNTFYKLTVSTGK